MKEEWRAIPDYPGYYISTFGNVRSARYNKGNRLAPVPLATWLSNAGYPVVGMYHSSGKYDRKLVHRLVMAVFVGECPEGCETNHRDANRQNAALSNLEYVTRRANQLDRWRRIKAKRLVDVA